MTVGERIGLLALSVSSIDRGRPADEITSEEHRYGRTNELSEMAELKLVLCCSPTGGIQTALIWNQTADYSAN